MKFLETKKDRKRLILFLAEGANNLHLMAESFARLRQPKNIVCLSASMTPPVVNPITNHLLHEENIDLSDQPMLTLLDIEPFMFDLIVTLGDFDQSCRPNLPGMPPHIHWDVPDPNHMVDKDTATESLRRSRSIIKENIDRLFDSDLLSALFVTRRNLELILDNLMDGIMAHTFRRRIFFFNKAAEEITGYRRESLIGKDCHDVFPGKFCGGDCDFCENVSASRQKSIIEKKINFNRPDGKTRNLRMAIMPLSDESGKEIGALLSFKDVTELDQLKQRLKHHHALGQLIGKDPKTILLFEQIKEVSSVIVPVLIQGESGTGKELAANAIHDIGPRASKPFVAINCAALPEGILESELFGHVKGAFSGAIHDRKGRFELAHEGTLFLDEIGELSHAMQVKLLRVLQEKQFERVGGEKSIKINVRVISATNQDLRRLMKEKKFRRDLYYRLCVIPIMITPLRERRLDIPVLIEHFIEVVAKEIGRPPLTPSNTSMDLLSSYAWPGNVRELRNAIEYAYVKCRTGTIETEHLPPEIVEYKQKRGLKPGPPLKHSKETVLMALSKAQGNRQEAARLLGVGRATLYRYLENYRIK